MFGTCQSYSRQAEKIVAEVRMREGVSLLKNCQKLIKTKDAEIQKATERLQKEVKKSLARHSSGSRAALIGVKSINRTKLQIEQNSQVKSYLERVMTETREVMVKGKANPANMVLPTDMESIKKEIKKIEKEVEKCESTSTISTVADSERFLKELEDLDASYNSQ